jgi:hypothetical protein
MRVCLLALVIVGCGEVKSEKTDAAIDSHTVDTPKMIDAPMGPQDAPAGTVALTVKNYLSWCSVKVNGGTASTAASQVVNVTPGTIPLAADALAGFKLDANMWHHTNGDTAGTGEGGTVTGTTSSTAVTVGTTAKCVWVCCPFTDGSGCNVADQCP